MKVPAALAGKQGRCPGCRRGLEVPLADAARSASARRPRGESARAERGRSERSRAPSARAQRASGRAAADPSTDDRQPSEVEGPAEAAPAADARPCPACGAEAPIGAKACPGCEAPLPPTSVPWTVIAAFVCFLPFALPGLILAQLGLRHARARGRHVGLAWVAVVLNGVSLVTQTSIVFRRNLQEIRAPEAPPRPGQPR